MKVNPQIELAFEFVQNTNSNIFLTGKAGTGKTTFLHRIKREINKRMAVVAPTGVAAINAKGVTIHSLFQLPFGPILPNQKSTGAFQQRFNKRKINLLKSLDLLIIDEISMVRSDVLDGIDGILRRYKNRSLPFGGVQLLMIGDLNQLAPVVRPQEWNLLRTHYETEYFFGSLALKQTHFISIELKHIYRQSNEEFIALLNKVRDNKLDERVLEQLNSRFIDDFKPDRNEGYVTLASHNRTAKGINADRLSELPEESFQFEAEVDGVFPENAFPNEDSLEFKLGAQVMFIKNDPSEEKRYYNGKLGRITEINQKEIKVLCDGDLDEIEVSPLEWHNTKYSLNEKTKEIEEEVIGTFEQIPLKLAWAITIHKSQGLTFDRVIIDAQDAFAHGQVYVALSRCKTFEGIVLRSKIQNSSIKTDTVIQKFTQEAQENEPGQEELLKAKHRFQQEILLHHFDMKNLKYAVQNFHRAVLEGEKSLQGTIVQDTKDLSVGITSSIFGVGNKFLPALQEYFTSDQLPEKNSDLKDRLKKAGVYFAENIENKILKEVSSLNILTDNVDVEGKVEERWGELMKELRKTLMGFKVCISGFTAQKFIRSITDVDIDSKEKKKNSKSGPVNAPSNIDHKELYKKLIQWRNETADHEDVKVYQILTTRSIIEICNVLPSMGSSLKRIHGIGKVKLDNYGETILEIVNEYIDSEGLSSDQMNFASSKKEKNSTGKKKSKKPTAVVSLELYQGGKNVDEIAKERGFTTGTILTHLVKYIRTGQVELTDLVEETDIRVISDYFLEKKVYGLKEAKGHFGDSYDYNTLKIVREGLGLDDY